MKRLALISLLLTASWAGATACPTGYAWTATITVKHNASLSADVSNWPEVFTCGNTVCKTTGNGGQVTDAGAKDVVFCTGASGGTILTYELVPSSFSATAGTAEWWILLPTISKTADQTIHAVIGKSSPTDFSCNASGATCGTALFPGCLLTYHLGFDNGSSSSLSLVDSCGGHTATNNNGVTKVDNTTFPPVYEYANAAGASHQWLDTGYAPGSAISGSFSVELWLMNSDTTVGELHSIWGNRNASVQGTESWITTSSPCTGGGFSCFSVSVLTDSSNWKQWTSNVNWTSTPQHFATTHVGGSAGVMQMYSNGAAVTTGVLASSGSAVDPGNSASTWQIFSCGSLQCSSTNYSGAEDEFRLYNTTLTADQILSDFTFQNSPTSQYTISAAAAATGSFPAVY